MAENNVQNGFVSGNPSGQTPATDADKLREGIVHGAGDIAREVKHVAGDVVGQAKKAAEDKIGSGKDFAAEHLGSVADALRTTGEQLKSKESAVTEYVTMAADQVDKVSHYLETRTLSQLFGDIEGFAKREPAIFLGGSFVLGILGGRFLKSATPKKKEVAGGYSGASLRPALPAAGSSYGPTKGPSSGPSPSASADLGGMSAVKPRPPFGMGEGTSPSGHPSPTSKPSTEPSGIKSTEPSGIKSTEPSGIKAEQGAKSFPSTSNSAYDASNRADTTPNATATKPADAKNSASAITGGTPTADKPRNGIAGVR